MANSNPELETLEEEQRPPRIDRNLNQSSQEWETMARAWLTAFPEPKTVSTTAVESWIDSNRGYLPADLQSMPRSDLIDRLLAIQNYMRLPNQAIAEANEVDIPHARFQRTDQWLPVYSWLESLDKDEAVKSKDISDWLTENPDIKEHLCSKHSRYHLMHYIKKCHMKILKRREKKKGLQQNDKPTSPKAHKIMVIKESTPVPSNPLNNIPKDSDLYLVKRNEAHRKFEILRELKKTLSPHFLKPQGTEMKQ
ncbi:uncharacterized protein LOC126685773 isoform X2 [Mercurialis annua]|uniref:uncharacterized protein LOC126685773 isoform X2 n=1 Tax=Mercurialis annua TaxID=3986 RepID=UPI00215FA868|nr:uncharacterized protein LOC126685773 isoform X2 [Mercurialis annua]